MHVPRERVLTQGVASKQPSPLDHVEVVRDEDEEKKKKGSLLLFLPFACSIP